MSLDRALQVGGIVISLVGAGLLYSFPNVKWLGWVSAGVGIAVLLGATMWVFGSRHGVKEYKAQHRTAPSALAQPLDGGLVSERQPKAAAKHVPPVFTPTANTRIVTYAIDMNSLTLNREPYRDPNTVSVALAQFLYNPDEGVDSYLFVSAHVFLYKPDGTRVRPEIYNAVWDADEPRPSKEFHAGHVHDLIIALFANIDPVSIVLYEHDSAKHSNGGDHSFSPKIHEVQGDDFFVRVDLIIKRFPSEPVPKQSFWFRLTLEPNAEFKPVDSPDFAK